jgi:transposase
MLTGEMSGGLSTEVMKSGRAGRDVYYRRHRRQWLEKVPEAGTRRRAEQLSEQLDLLRHLRQQARRELLAEGRKHTITARLRQIPCLGPIRSALAVALMQTPHRFRSKRQLWTYSGLGLETRDSGEYHYVRGQSATAQKTGHDSWLEQGLQP